MIFVFEIRIKPGYSADRYAEAWVEAQARFVEIAVVGEFEDPEWVVLPGELGRGTRR